MGWLEAVRRYLPELFVRILLGLLPAVGLLLFAAGSTRAQGATLTVCDQGCDFSEIQAAVLAANDGDTIQLLFTSAHTEDDIVVTRSVTIAGLGESNTIVQAAAAPGTAANRVFTIFTGFDVHFQDLTIRHGHGIFTLNGAGIYNEGSDVTLTRVLVRDNEAGNGGGIYSAGGTLTLVDAWVYNNTGLDDGGGIYNAGTLLMEASSVTFNDNGGEGGGIFNSGTAILSDSDVSFNDTLTNPSSDLRGGGIYNEGTLMVMNSTVRFNEMAATDDSYLPGGGGVYSSGGELSLIDSVVAYNTINTDHDGAGLYLDSSDTTIRRSTIHNNQTESSSSKTGGLYLVSGTLTMTDSTVRDNSGSNGGGMRLANGTVELRHTTIHGNESNYGGGLYVCGAAGTVTLTNVTLSNNEATRDGGGIYVCPSAELSLANVTVTGNRADSDDDGLGNGGGVYLDTSGQNTGKINLKNTILAGNDDLSNFPATAAYDCFGDVTSEGYNLIGNLGFGATGTPPCSVGGDPTGNLIGESALLDALADNGGPTLTHALQTGSPAVNAGDPAGCTDSLGALLPADQRHGLRPDRCDMGAFELGALVEKLYLPLTLKD